MSIILLIGASGSGKTTIGKGLEKAGIPQLISFTTRPMRKGEVDGVDYYFVKKNEIKNIDLVEYSEYNGNIYGLSKEEVETKLKKYNNVYFVADKNGAKQIINMYPKETSYFWIKIKKMLMIERLLGRGDSQEAMKERIAHAIQTGEFEKPMLFTSKVYELNAENSVSENIATILNEVNK